MKLAMHLALLAALALVVGACGGGGGGGGGDDGGGRAAIPGESGGGGSAAGAGSSDSGSSSSAGETASEGDGNQGGAPAQTPSAPSDHSYLMSMLLTASDARLAGFLAYEPSAISVEGVLGQLQDEFSRLLERRSSQRGGGSLLFDSSQQVLQSLIGRIDRDLAERDMEREMLEWVREVVATERRAIDAQVMLATLEDAVVRSALATDPALRSGMIEAGLRISDIHTAIRYAVDAALAEGNLGAGRSGDLEGLLPPRTPPTPLQIASLLVLDRVVIQPDVEIRGTAGEPEARALARALYEYALAAYLASPADFNGSAARMQLMQIRLDMQIAEDAAQEGPSDPGAPQGEQLQLEARAAHEDEPGAVFVTVRPAQAVSWFTDQADGVDAEPRDDGLLPRSRDGGPTRVVRVTAVALDGGQVAELDVLVGSGVGTEPHPATGRNADGEVLLGATNEPIHGALVEVRDPRLAPGGVIRSIFTDEAGRFRFEDLPGEQLEIVVTVAGLAMEEGIVVLESLETIDPENANSDGIQVRMITVD